MGFLDALLGRTRKARSHTDRIYAISTACIALEARHQMEPVGRAGVVFRPVASSYYEEAQREVREALQVSERMADTHFRLQADDYGYQWAILEDPDFEDLVTAIHMVGETLQAHGYRDQLLAALFGFRREGRTVYWIYNYKSGKFYPFVPTGQARQRDNALETRLGAAMRKELPIADDPSEWYGLWGIPF